MEILGNKKIGLFVFKPTSAEEERITSLIADMADRGELRKGDKLFSYQRFNDDDEEEAIIDFGGLIFLAAQKIAGKTVVCALLAPEMKVVFSAAQVKFLGMDYLRNFITASLARN